MTLNKVPLAWRNMTADKRRLAASVAAITFAVFLMFMQIGFRNAMLDSSVEFIHMLDGDLFLVGSRKYRMFTPSPFPRRRLHQVLMHPEVEYARPLYVEQERSLWKNPRDRTNHVIRVFAFDPDEPVFVIPEVNQHLEELKLPDTVLLDTKCRSFIGAASAGMRTELARRTVRVVGTFSLGTDFIVDGNVLMSDRNYLKYFSLPNSPRTRLTHVEVGVVKLKSNVNAVAVKGSLTRELPADVRVMTRAEFIGLEKGYWAAVSPVGLVFAVGTAVGFIVGTVICYQILFTDLSDQLPQFATLKAIGYENRDVQRSVLIQAFLLSLVSFLVGWLLSYAGYQLIIAWTGLQMRMGWALIFLMYVLTVFMCAMAGIIAMRKVATADPAEVF